MTERIAVLGLGYVGLPVAVGLARAHGGVLGFDVDAGRVAALRRGEDATGEFAAEELAGLGLAYPYGRGSLALTPAAQTAGFAWAATARGGRNSAATPAHRLRRTLMHGRDGAGRFALKCWLGYAALVEWRMDARGVP